MGFSTAMQAMISARCQAMLHQCLPYFTGVKSIACIVAIESNGTRYIGASIDMQAMMFSMVMPVGLICKAYRSEHLRCQLDIQQRIQP